MFLRKGINKQGVTIERYRLPTEAEWEMAARNANSDNKYPWESDATTNESGCFQANFKPGDGAYGADNHLIPAKVRSFKPNNSGLYDMAGNVAEWTSTAYTESGNKLMGDLNPEYSRSDIRDSEYQNRGRSYIGFRCVRTQVSSGK